MIFLRDPCATERTANSCAPTPISGFLIDRRGQDLVEYVLLLAFLALTVAAMFLGMSTSVSSIWNTANSHLSKGHHYAKGKDK